MGRGNRQKQDNVIVPDTERVLSAFGGDSGAFGGDPGAFGGDPREEYRMFVERKIPHTEHETQIMKDIKENELWLPW